ncbi:MAG: ATP-binding cassette domain-containing protein [Eubacteriaceae bacterium]|nr:ATP-binding cassette domain-containing protein [Eubacteriaceae bacterium]
MIQVTDLTLSFGSSVLFKDVDLLFTKGNCYGVIGANGSGKSTFLKLLNSEMPPSKGNIYIDPVLRMSVLKQDHFEFDGYTALETVILGNPRLFEVMKAREAIYAKEDFTNEDGLEAAELEAEFAELDGWEAESDASKLVQGLGLGEDVLEEQMSSLQENAKIKVLLAQALFGNPDIVLLDEPTNGLDIACIAWLEEFLIGFEGILIVVSHDRHFLNSVCTHIVDIDYSQIKMYVGNYEFWYESSQLIQAMLRQQNKKKEDKAKELVSFIQRFSANKSKSRQASSRKKMLEKLSIEEMPASSRKYPFIAYEQDREAGKEILTVENLTKTANGEKVIDNVSFTIKKGEKVAFVGEWDIANTTMLKLLAGELEPDSGTIKWGVSTVRSYFPADNSDFFENEKLSILKWLEQYSKDTTETYLRSFLGRMLFSQEEVFKEVNVLSGGERVRCMLSRMMMFKANVLLFDQPTNHLDLESITALNNGIIAYKGTVLFSSHDHEFVHTIADRIMELKPSGFADRLGLYDDYLEAEVLAPVK